MRVRVSLRHIFLLLMRVLACVRACVRVCVCVCFFILYFFTMVCILFRISFQIHLMSRWQCQHRSCSRFPTQYRSPLAHVLSLSRSSLTSIHALLTKHAQRTSKSCCWTLFRSRPFRFLLFCQVLLHQPLNDTLASVEAPSFAWSSDIVSPTSFSPVYKGYGSSASALHRHGVCFGFVCKRIEHAPNRKKAFT